MKDSFVTWRSLVVLGGVIAFGAVPRAGLAQDQDQAKIKAGGQTFAEYC